MNDEITSETLGLPSQSTAEFPAQLPEGVELLDAHDFREAQLDKEYVYTNLLRYTEHGGDPTPFQAATHTILREVTRRFRNDFSCGKAVAINYGPRTLYQPADYDEKVEQAAKRLVETITDLSVN